MEHFFQTYREDFIPFFILNFVFFIIYFITRKLTKNSSISYLFCLIISFSIYFIFSTLIRFIFSSFFTFSYSQVTWEFIFSVDLLFLTIVILLISYNLIKIAKLKDDMRINFFNSLVEQVNTIQEDLLFSDPPKIKRFISNDDLFEIKDILKKQSNKQFDHSNTIQFKHNDIKFSVILSQSFNDYFYSKKNKTLQNNENTINKISFCEEFTNIDPFDVIINIDPFDVMDLLDLSSLFEINKDYISVYNMFKE